MKKLRAGRELPVDCEICYKPIYRGQMYVFPQGLQSNHKVRHLSCHQTYRKDNKHLHGNIANLPIDK